MTSHQEAVATTTTTTTTTTTRKRTSTTPPLSRPRPLPPKTAEDQERINAAYLCEAVYFPENILNQEHEHVRMEHHTIDEIVFESICIGNVMNGDGDDGDDDKNHDNDDDENDDDDDGEKEENEVEKVDEEQAATTMTSTKATVDDLQSGAEGEEEGNHESDADMSNAKKRGFLRHSRSAGGGRSDDSEVGVPAPKKKRFSFWSRSTEGEEMGTEETEQKQKTTWRRFGLSSSRESSSQDEAEADGQTKASKPKKSGFLAHELPYAIAMDKTNATLYLVVRGTDPTAIQNWLYNLRVNERRCQEEGLADYGPVHAGFLAYAQRLAWKSILLAPQRRNTYRRVVFCGHSLGGAVASLATLLLLDQWKTIPESDRTFTFPPPPPPAPPAQEELQKSEPSEKVPVENSNGPFGLSWFCCGSPESVATAKDEMRLQETKMEPLPPPPPPTTQLVTERDVVCYTFGAPLFAGEDFARCMVARQYDQQLEHWVHPSDLVPRSLADTTTGSVRFVLGKMILPKLMEGALQLAGLHPTVAIAIRFQCQEYLDSVSHKASPRYAILGKMNNLVETESSQEPVEVTDLASATFWQSLVTTTKQWTAGEEPASKRFQDAARRVIPKKFFSFSSSLSSQDITTTKDVPEQGGKVENQNEKKEQSEQEHENDTKLDTAETSSQWNPQKALASHEMARTYIAHMQRIVLGGSLLVVKPEGDQEMGDYSPEQ